MGTGIFYLRFSNIAGSKGPFYTFSNLSRIFLKSVSMANSVIETGASYEVGPGVTVASDIGFYEDDLME